MRDLLSVQAIHHVGHSFETIAKSFDGLAASVVVLKGAIQVSQNDTITRVTGTAWFIICFRHMCCAAFESEHQSYCSRSYSSWTDYAVWRQRVPCANPGHQLVDWLLDTISLPPVVSCSGNNNESSRSGHNLDRAIKSRSCDLSLSAVLIILSQTLPDPMVVLRLFG